MYRGISTYKCVKCVILRDTQFWYIFWTWWFFRVGSHGVSVGIWDPTRYHAPWDPTDLWYLSWYFSFWWILIYAWYTLICFDTLKYAMMKFWYWLIYAWYLLISVQEIDAICTENRAAPPNEAAHTPLLTLFCFYVSTAHTFVSSAAHMRGSHFFLIGNSLLPTPHALLTLLNQGPLKIMFLEKIPGVYFDAAYIWSRQGLVSALLNAAWSTGGGATTRTYIPVHTFVCVTAFPESPEPTWGRQ